MIILLVAVTAIHLFLHQKDSYYNKKMFSIKINLKFDLIWEKSINNQSTFILFI